MGSAPILHQWRTKWENSAQVLEWLDAIFRLCGDTPDYLATNEQIRQYSNASMLK
jgi:hypothetical protein